MTLREVLEKVRAGELTAEQGAVLIAAMQQADGGSRDADQAEAQKRHAAAEDERDVYKRQLRGLP